MEDKTFELLTKMYNEMQTGFKEIRSEMDTGFKEVRQEISDVKQDIVRLENKMDDNHKALYDGYKQSIEGINELRTDVKDLKAKVENQEIKLKVIQGGK